jgi:glycosyltransferase involved in cell wall biosynthesis
MPGAIYGTGYHELQSHSFAYIHATEVGGTHPALIEAMGRGALTLYLDTVENREVAGDAAIPFTHSKLADQLRLVLSMSEAQRAELRRRAVALVETRYSWEAVTDAYERLLTRLASRAAR